MGFVVIGILVPFVLLLLILIFLKNIDSRPKNKPLERVLLRDGKEYWGIITSGPHPMAGGVVEFSVTVQNADTIFNPEHYGAIASEHFVEERGLAVGSRVLLGPWLTNGDKGRYDEIHIIEGTEAFL